MTLRAHLVRNEKFILIQLHQKVPCQLTHKIEWHTPQWIDFLDAGQAADRMGPYLTMAWSKTQARSTTGKQVY